ncbi:MAG: formylglycine-generating enzyme family protein [Bacteroidetes bacterium]|nr:formylglycine-generating enzyme family protein [Bacteroidota bacterium]
MNIKFRKMAITAITTLFFVGIANAQTEGKRIVEQVQKSPTVATYKNLTIVLIHGKDVVERNYLTLEEAMKQKKVTLHETGTVNELSIDNASADYVFIMAGDIVKGGRQDRTIAVDIVLEPNAQQVPLKVFCVEPKRWTGRGAGGGTIFYSSEKMLCNKALKTAARVEQNQSKVWEEVANYRKNVSKQLSCGLARTSSLQITLENDEIQFRIAEYVNALRPAFRGKNDVVGFAFFINGEISAIETFGNAALFRKVQKKLLEAAAAEALEQYDGNLQFEKPTSTELIVIIESAENRTATTRQITINMMEYTTKTKQGTVLRSVNTDASEVALRTNILSAERLKLEENEEDKQNIQIAQDTQNAQRALDEISNNLVFIVNGEIFDMIFVEGGSFTMGCTNEQSDCGADEKPTHRVRLDDYYIGTYEVTQKLWKTVMGTNPSEFKGQGCENLLPVENVYYLDCVKFCDALNLLLAEQLPKGYKFQLPTEAQWEYAARGGKKTQGYLYSGSNSIDEVAWYEENGEKKTHEVGLKKPNELGIYDMSGNVWEWCYDWFGTYRDKSEINPRGVSVASRRVTRGGSWESYAPLCRTTNRSYSTQGYRCNFLGFRLALAK